MSRTQEPHLHLEVGHILFLDIVGYSKLLSDEQKELVQKLNQIVRETEQFRAAEAEGKLTRLPTGDGMVLVFTNIPEAPVECALEISKALQSHPKLKVRMGIHSGPVNPVADVNDQSNLLGAGINVAQRVMYCGDAGHILMSSRFAEDLEHYARWRPHLHDAGTIEAKHGTKIPIVNFYTDQFGNSALPAKLRRRKTAFRIKSAAVAALLLIAVLGLAFWVLHRPQRFINGVGAIPSKSIAVLPFENLSADPENAFFTDGVQDEILTDLSKIADLKVISRTSAMHYKSGVARNLREIAQQLGVAHVLEGSVQRAGNKVRVNAQLVDTRTDKHLWGQTYDRDLADVFAIQSEISQKIADQLEAKISPREKAAIEQQPTGDIPAYDLYVRAKALIENSVVSGPQKDSLLEAIRLLNQAIQRDPAFALAYYQLAYAHDRLYFAGIDHTPARSTMADAAIQSLARLRPDSGEVHLALAMHLYFVHFDYDRAAVEVGLAKKSLPNDPVIFWLAGFIERRQGRWQQSTENLERAAELDPQNPFVLQQMANSYECLRRYSAAERVLDRAIALAPKDSATRVFRPQIEFAWHADPRPVVSTIEAILAENPREAENIAEAWFHISLCQRDPKAAQRAFAALPIDGCQIETFPFPSAWCEGLIARESGDAAAARAAFSRARSEVDQILQAQPDYAQALGVAGMIDAALGQKEDAIREGRRASELLPVSKSSIEGGYLIQYLAIIYAWCSEKDRAMEQLDIAVKLPGYLSYGALRLHPIWDPLRGDPRFEKIVEEANKPVVLK